MIFSWSSTSFPGGISKNRALETKLCWRCRYDILKARSNSKVNLDDRDTFANHPLVFCSFYGSRKRPLSPYQTHCPQMRTFALQWSLHGVYATVRAQRFYVSPSQINMGDRPKRYPANSRHISGRRWVSPWDDRKCVCCSKGYRSECNVLHGVFSLQCRRFHRARANGFNRESAMLKLPKRGGNGASQGEGEETGRKKRKLTVDWQTSIYSPKPHQSGAPFASVRRFAKEQCYRAGVFFSSPSPLFFFCPHTYHQG